MAERSAKAKRSPLPGLAAQVSSCLRGVVLPRQRLVLGLSGGIDSMVLLDVLAKLAVRERFQLQTLHVNHGLSPNATAWARFCRDECRRRSVPCRVVKVEVPRANSIERAAREARYAVFAQSRADHLVLAHNLDDQAETILLQLLRGTGVKGLAAMPSVRAARPPLPSIIRPLLNVARRDIERYAGRNGVRCIEDESNDDTRFTRNWLRGDVLPRIAERVPAYRDALARAARNAAEAAALLDELGRMDAEKAIVDHALSLEVLRAMSPARAKNVLRHVIDARGWSMPDSARLEEALRQALRAGADATVVVSLGSCELRRHGGLVYLVARAPADPVPDIVTWRGERELALPGGVLAMKHGKGKGMSLARLDGRPLTIRQRLGGERLRPDAKRPRRTVKNLLQESGIPPWRRERLPFIYCGDVLACVPGLGVDCEFQARPDEPAVIATWRDIDSPRARPPI